jgi:transposase
MHRWSETGSIEAKPSGGSVSPLDDHAEFLLGLIVEQPDMTLDEIVAAMSRAGIAGSRTALWWFYERHGVSFKKTLYAAEQKRADVIRTRRRWMREQGMFDPARLTLSL